jgi:hypothetical protein
MIVVTPMIYSPAVVMVAPISIALVVCDTVQLAVLLMRYYCYSYPSHPQKLYLHFH